MVMKNALCAFGFSLAALFLGTAAPAGAAIVPGFSGPVSGSSTWVIEMEVTDYFFGIAAAVGAPQIGDKASRTVSATFTGSIDYPVIGPLFYELFFSNGWEALSNTGLANQTTTCGFAINFCVGALAGPEYVVVEAQFDLDHEFTALADNPQGGSPVRWLLFNETVILESTSVPGDFHYFTAKGRSISGRGGITEIPLPASGVLLAAALVPLVARRRGRAGAARRDRV
jgi:hypothetical protein